MLSGVSNGGGVCQTEHTYPSGILRLCDNAITVCRQNGAIGTKPVQIELAGRTSFGL